MSPQAALDRPLLRGHVHLVCAIVAPFALALLLVLANSPAAYAGAAIFGAGLILLFSVSAAYHLAPWPPSARAIVKRIDHSAIFLAIAAFYTPFCLQSLSLEWGIPVLAMVWALSAVGVALNVGWPSQPRWLSTASYLAVGWLALITIYPLTTALPLTALAAMVIAGALYSLGALAYAARWPNPVPRYFGHHEIFHTLVAAATATLYAVVALEVLPS